MGEFLSHTDLLFAAPSFSEGIGRLIDFGDTLTEFNRSRTPEEADALALRSDWCAVGADLKAAMAQEAHEPGKPTE